MSRDRTVAQFLVRIFIRPIFPFLQWLVQSLGFMCEAHSLEGAHRRQPFLIRSVAPEETQELLIGRLARAGFYPNRIALNDPGQTASLRRICDTHADKQYHIRFFEDGEMRGHYEYTPEDRPLSHWNEVLLENRREEFLRWLDAA